MITFNDLEDIKKNDFKDKENDFKDLGFVSVLYRETNDYHEFVFPVDGTPKNVDLLQEKFNMPNVKVGAINGQAFVSIQK